MVYDIEQAKGHEKEFSNFLKKNKGKIKKIKEEYKDEVTEAGIQDLLLLLWLLGEDEAVIFEKVKRLLNTLLKGRFIKLLSTFKLASDKVKKKPKEKKKEKEKEKKK